jgi:uncharacterized membrane protein
MLNDVGRVFLRGLGVVVPLSLTLYIAYAVIMASERAVGGMISALLPQGWYCPGVGTLVALVLVFVIGVLTRVPLVNVLFRFTSWVLEKLPVVRTIYSTTKDFMNFISSSPGDGEDKKAVLVKLAEGADVIGFVTNADPAQMLGNDLNDRVMVYFPMSYQVGGYSVLVERERITEIDVTMEDAMSFILTAGIRSDPVNERKGV